MADAAGVSVEWLATGRGPMRPAAHADGSAEHRPPPRQMVPVSLPGQPSRVTLEVDSQADAELLEKLKGLNIGQADAELLEKLRELNIRIGEARPINWYPLPLYASRLSAGDGAEPVADERPTHVSYRREWLQTIYPHDLRHLAVARVTGQSMEPELYEGAEVFIDTSPDGRTLTDGLFAYRSDDQVFIKHLHRVSSRRIKVISANPFWEPTHIDLPGPDSQETSFQIIGRVIYAVTPRPAPSPH